MILTDEIERIARARAEGPPLTDAILERWPVFRNTPYRLARTPLVVDRQAIELMRPVVEAYVRALNALLERFVAEPDRRAWFALPSSAEELIDADGPGRAVVRVCRLDTYCGWNGSHPWMQVLENNADSPAGTLFTTRLSAISRATWGATGTSPFPMARDESPFVDLLLRESRSERPLVVVLQPRNGANRESVEVVAELRGRGAYAELADPCDLGVGDGGFVLDGRFVDVIWNKVNTVVWADLADREPATIDRWCAALAGGATSHLNGFAARYVAEAKTALAYLRTDEFRTSIPAELRAAVDALLPTCHVVDGETRALARSSRERWVLKQRYDIRGDGVTVGVATGQDEWERLIDDAVDTGAIVQEYVEASRAPVLYDDGELAWHRQSLDWFVFDGCVVGLGAKASPHPKVNLFQGGTKLDVVLGR